ncbi:MAG TPA: metal ABC transporter permease, partial [Ktedonobacteraceae bacterium]|nr:metal ABC transporter permease [Ktedonobacteraceae bacterium]
VAALVGYFLVIRGLTFAGHAMSHIGFAGAAGALLFGLDPLFGLLVFTIGAGVGIGLLGSNARQRDIIIGILMTVALGVGSMCIALYHAYAEAAYSVLLGQVLGISQVDVLVTAIFSALVIGALLFLFRPLLFCSVDPEVARARGLPVSALSLLFLILVAITVSIAVLFVGVLLIFTLLVGPVATAMRLFRRPLWVILTAMLFGLLFIWGGILLAANGDWPVSFYITALSFGIYLPVRLLSPLWARKRGQPPVQSAIVHPEGNQEPAALTGPGRQRTA